MCATFFAIRLKLNKLILSSAVDCFSEINHLAKVITHLLIGSNNFLSNSQYAGKMINKKWWSAKIAAILLHQKLSMKGHSVKIQVDSSNLSKTIYSPNPQNTRKNGLFSVSLVTSDIYNNQFLWIKARINSDALLTWHVFHCCDVVLHYRTWMCSDWMIHYLVQPLKFLSGT